MAIEIERKFLLASDAWRASASRSAHLLQGYFNMDSNEATIRVRISDELGCITIKGRQNGAGRSEFEYRIPRSDAEDMMREFCGTRVVEKIRYVVPASDGLKWEIDEYLDRNAGLFTAEIELPYSTWSFEHPEWLGREITDDWRYSNGALSRSPWTTWR